MTCLTHSLGDVYEVTYTRSGVTSIICYRHGLDSRGESVVYDDLSIPVQNAIFNRLKQALQHDYNDTASDSSNSPDNEDRS